MGGAEVSLVSEMQYFCIFKDFESLGSFFFFFPLYEFFSPTEPREQISETKALLAAASLMLLCCHHVEKKRRQKCAESAWS